MTSPMPKPSRRSANRATESSLPAPASSSSSRSEQRHSSNVRKQSAASTVLDVGTVVLTMLRHISATAPIPYLPQAAELALGIVAAVQKTSSNADAFQRLASESCDLVCLVHEAWSTRANGRPLSVQFQNHLRQLSETLGRVKAYADQRLTRGRFARFISHNSDLEAVQALRDDLRHASTLFGLRSLTALRGQMEQKERRSMEAQRTHNASIGNINTTGNVNVNQHTGDRVINNHSYGNPINSNNVLSSVTANANNVYVAPGGSYLAPGGIYQHDGGNYDAYGVSYGWHQGQRSYARYAAPAYGHGR